MTVDYFPSVQVCNAATLMVEMESFHAALSQYGAWGTTGCDYEEILELWDSFTLLGTEICDPGTETGAALYIHNDNSFFAQHVGQMTLCSQRPRDPLTCSEPLEVTEMCSGCKCDRTSSGNADPDISTYEACLNAAIADGLEYFTYHVTNNYCVFGDEYSSGIACSADALAAMDVGNNWKIYKIECLACNDVTEVEITNVCTTCKCDGAGSSTSVEGLHTLEDCAFAAYEAGYDTFSYRSDVERNIEYCVFGEEYSSEENCVTNRLDDVVDSWSMYTVVCPLDEDEDMNFREKSLKYTATSLIELPVAEVVTNVFAFVGFATCIYLIWNALMHMKQNKTWTAIETVDEEI